jgi:nicotinic acid mononucleotide adenylyltransferase
VETSRLTAPLTPAFPSIFLVDAVTPNVSSTEIRRRAANGAPLTPLVPEAVAHYIATHHLYV